MINKLKYNTRIKIFALLSAVVLWLYVMTAVDPVIVQSYRDISATITNINDIRDNNLSILSDDGLSADIYIKGRMSALKRIKKSDIYIYGKVDQPRDGKNVVDLKADLPGGATYQLNPQVVTIDLEKEISVEKKIEVEVEGKLVNEIGNVEINKRTTSVHGPRSLINKVRRVMGVLVAEERKEEITSKIALKAVDKNGKQVNGVKVQDEFVLVNATLLKSKQVPIKIKFEGELPDGYKLKGYNSSQQSIQIRGKDDILAKINEISTYPISLNTIDKDSIININLQLPQGVMTNLKNIPVNIDIFEDISSVFEIPKDNISFINNNRDLDTNKNNLPDKIKIDITYSDEIGDLTHNDIKLYVDLEDTSLGDNKYKIRYDIPHEINKINIQPETVTLSE